MELVFSGRLQTAPWLHKPLIQMAVFQLNQRGPIKAKLFNHSVARFHHRSVASSSEAAQSLHFEVGDINCLRKDVGPSGQRKQDRCVAVERGHTGAGPA